MATKDTTLFFRLKNNQILFYFGIVMLLGGVITAILSLTTTITVLGINAYIKPMKFFISVWLFVWTMGYYTSWMVIKKRVKIYSWVCAIGLGFELLAITYQASLGKMSHFNNDTSFDAVLFALMGVVITTVIIWTAFIGGWFKDANVNELSAATRLSIRVAIFVTVIFAAEGGVMAALNAHSIGGPDGGPGLPLVNWSVRYGDLRVAHFLGLHALQVIPLCCFFFFKSKRGVVLFSSLYVAVTLFTLIQGSLGRPLVSL